ncbi:hypothetical protein LAUMK4_03900 [Mycobacterium persicum]|uniref:Uncharacterized protein n=1 Tax=Mycobacterium persicum TaxID=1487726 RepID=A0ABY6RM27_9MYCO|nr:hypothetical protein LAUMK15_04307 [Mycobacterium persicum]VAZ97622.1 hypothetical protein LAUMK4_03900 [Mycobacterium persicum]
MRPMQPMQCSGRMPMKEALKRQVFSHAQTRASAAHHDLVTGLRRGRYRSHHRDDEIFDHGPLVGFVPSRERQ